METSSETSKSDEQQKQQQPKESTESLQPQMVLPNTHLPDQCELCWQHKGQQIDKLDSPYTFVSATPSPRRSTPSVYNEG